MSLWENPTFFSSFLDENFVTSFRFWSTLKNFYPLFLFCFWNAIVKSFNNFFFSFFVNIPNWVVFFFNKFSRNFKKFRLNENNFCIFVLENILIIDIISGEGVESGISGEVSFFDTTLLLLLLLYCNYTVPLFPFWDAI